MRSNYNFIDVQKTDKFKSVSLISKKFQIQFLRNLSEMCLNVDDLSGNPSVDAFSSFLRCLDDDSSDCSLHVAGHQATGIDTQAVVKIPHVVFHVARHHQNVGYFVNRSELVQQS